MVITVETEKGRGDRKLYIVGRMTGPVINQDGFFVNMGTASKLLPGAFIWS